jgi:uncharacterized membrane protein
MAAISINFNTRSVAPEPERAATAAVWPQARVFEIDLQPGVCAIAVRHGAQIATDAAKNFIQALHAMVEPGPKETPPCDTSVESMRSTGLFGQDARRRRRSLSLVVNPAEAGTGGHVIGYVIDEMEARRVVLFRGAETHVRSVLKAISWRTLGTLDTFAISWLLTGKVEIAGSIAGLEIITKIAWYYLHERIWAAIHWGRRHQ